MVLFESSQASMHHHSPSVATEIPSLVTTEQDPATLITYETNTGSSALANNVPTYMSWSGQSRAFIGGPPDSSSTSSSMIPEAPTDPGPPPDYSQPYIPSKVITYTFSLTDHDAMLLVPPASALDSRPLYHISISANPFIPTVSTTTIRRGATEKGDRVADFEWGPIRLSPSVSMGSTRIECSEALFVCSMSMNYPEYTWEWNGDLDHRMYWHCDDNVAICYLWPTGSKRPRLKKDMPLAQFCGRPIKRRAGDRQGFPPIILRVHPDGHVGPRFNYILLGALMIERKRLSLV